MIRYTNVLHALRCDGDNDAADVIERARKQFPPCVTHGEITDPIVVLNQRYDLLFACPFCSGAAVLAAWRAEVPKIRF